MEQVVKSKNLFSKLFTALYGLSIPYSTEVSIRIQTGIVVVAVFLGFYFHISHSDWMFVVIASAILLLTECLNTAIEKLVDLVSPGYHELAGKVKDIAAGAVFLAGLTSFIIALLVFVPYINK